MVVMGETIAGGWPGPTEDDSFGRCRPDYAYAMDVAGIPDT